MSLRLSSSTRQKFCPLDKLHTSVPYPILGHPVELLRERVLVGSATECIEKLANLQAAGVRKVFLWPVADDAAQLAKFQEDILPQLPQ